MPEIGKYTKPMLLSTEDSNHQIEVYTEKINMIETGKYTKPMLLSTEDINH